MTRTTMNCPVNRCPGQVKPTASGFWVCPICKCYGVHDDVRGQLAGGGASASEPDPREGRGCLFNLRTGTCTAQPVCPLGTKICQPRDVEIVSTGRLQRDDDEIEPGDVVAVERFELHLSPHARDRLGLTGLDDAQASERLVMLLRQAAEGEPR